MALTSASEHVCKMNDADNQLYQALGRLEGKLDMLLAQGTAQGRRIEMLEGKVATLEGAARAAGNVTSKWVTSVLAAGAIFISILNYIAGHS